MTETPTERAEAINAERITPETDPRDYIDVTLEHANGGRSILRFDVLEGESRFQYELGYEGATLDCDPELIEIAAEYIEETHSLTAFVPAPDPRLPEGITQHLAVEDLD